MTKQIVILYVYKDTGGEPYISFQEEDYRIESSSLTDALWRLIRRGYHIDEVIPTLYRNGTVMTMATIVVSKQEQNPQT